MTRPTNFALVDAPALARHGADENVFETPVHNFVDYIHKLYPDKMISDVCVPSKHINSSRCRHTRGMGKHATCMRNPVTLFSLALHYYPLNDLLPHFDADIIYAVCYNTIGPFGTIMRQLTWNFVPPNGMTFSYPPFIVSHQGVQFTGHNDGGFTVGGKVYEMTPVKVDMFFTLYHITLRSEPLVTEICPPIIKRDALFSTLYEKCSIKCDRLSEWRDWFVFYDNLEVDKHVYVSKAILEACAAKCVFTKRDASGLSQLTLYCKKEYAKAEFVPPNDVDKSIAATIALAFVRNIHYEESLLHPVARITNVSPLTKLLNLTSYNPRGWNYKKILGAAALCLTALLGGTLAIRRSGKTATGFGIFGFVAWAMAFHKIRKQFCPIQNNNVIRVDPRHGPIELPCGTYNIVATNITSEMPLEKLEPGAEVKIEEDYKDPVKENPEAMTALISTPLVPTVFANNQQNMLVSIHNRAAIKLDLRLSTALFQRYIDCVLNLQDNGCLLTEPEPVSFEEWNQRFPPARAKAHELARQQLTFDDEKLPGELFKKCFIKSERLIKIDNAMDFKQTAPRCITGATDFFNVVTGPDIYSVSKMMINQFDGINAPFFYPSTRDNVYISEVFASSDFKYVYESDGSKWDRHMHRDFLTLEYSLYKPYISKPAYSVLMAAIKKKCFTNNGVKFSIDGTRSSGEPSTSCGNTLINLTTMFFVYVMSIEQLVLDGTLDCPNPFDEAYKTCLIFALGDDNLIFTKYPMLNVANHMADLGIKAKFKTVDRETATFCSCMFWHYSIDNVYKGQLLGQMPGRIIGKIGWIMNKPGLKLDDMKVQLCGTALSLLPFCQHVPILGPFIRRIIHLLRHKRDQASIDKYATPFQAVASEANSHTNEDGIGQFCQRYDLTSNQYDHLYHIVTTFPRLPWHFSDPLIKHIVEVDYAD